MVLAVNGEVAVRQLVVVKVLVVTDVEELKNYSGKTRKAPDVDSLRARSVAGLS